MRLRHDCLTGELVCMHCDSGTVVAIDMLGRVANIAGEYLLLSLCCCSFVYYGGTGHELDSTCGLQCASVIIHACFFFGPFRNVSDFLK